jgi:hypothetical protein
LIFARALLCDYFCAYVLVDIDDYLCVDGSKDPAFAGSLTDEFWVCLLEKAVAKAHGGFKQIDGGFNWWAFRLLTGCETQTYSMDAETGQWAAELHSDQPGVELDDITGSIETQDINEDGTLLDGDPLPTDDLYAVLKHAEENQFVMAAGTSGTDTLTQNKPGQEARGVVPGHAYCVKTIRNVGDFRLVKVRNPWHSFEWGGAWSDGAPEWDEHPEVKEALGDEYADDDTDGTFWMVWEDFLKVFSEVHVCMRGPNGKPLTN